MSNKVIESLSAEQLAAMPNYVEKWVKIGLDTSRANRKAAEEAAVAAYKVAGVTPPTTFLWAQSPIDAIKVTRDNFDASHKTDQDLLNEMTYGSMDAGWLSFYDYFREQCGIEACNDLVPLMNLAKDCGFWSAYENVIVFQEKPIKISMVSELLHNEKGPAIEYADGFKVYSLRGVQVPDWVIETPKEEINPLSILKIVDVDVRREAMRHVGIDRMFNLLDKKTIDTDTVNGQDYELVELTLGEDDGEKITGRFLKMNNPSIAAVHVEGVPDDVNTVKKALFFRNEEALKALGIKVFQAPDVLT